MSVLLVLFVGVILALYFWSKKNYNYWIERGFLSVPNVFPFGSMKGVATQVHSAERSDEFYKEHKGKAAGVGTFFFISPIFLVTDLETTKNILVRDFSSFHDRGFYYNKKDDPTSANILALEGSEWRERRVKLSPSFTSGKMKMMFEIVNTISDKFISVIDKDLKISSNLEMRELLAKFTTDVIGNVAFGIDSNCLENPNSEFRKYGKRLFDLSAFELLKFFMSAEFPNFSRALRLRQNPKEAGAFFLKTFVDTMQHRETSGIVRNDFVQLLLGLKKSGAFTAEELAAEGFIFYSGGFETSSTLMVFCIYELALNQDIQERLRDEIKSAIDENDGKLSYEMLVEMKYLDMVINETLRKYPPIPQHARKTTKEYKIPGTELILEKGVSVHIPVFSFQRDPEYFPEPEVFDPERFLPENVKTRHPFAFIPFGEGPRNYKTVFLTKFSTF